MGVHVVPSNRYAGLPGAMHSFTAQQATSVNPYPVTGSDHVPST